MSRQNRVVAGRHRRRIGRHLLLLSASVLAAWTGVLFAKQASEASTPSVLAGPARATAGLGERCGNYEGPGLRLVLIANHLSLQKNAIRLSAILCSTIETAEHLYIAREVALGILGRPSPAFRRLQYGVVELTKPAKAMRLHLTLWHQVAEGATGQSLDTTLGTLFESFSGVSLGDFAFPLIGSHASYPFDQYSNELLPTLISASGIEPLASHLLWCPHGASTCRVPSHLEPFSAPELPLEVDLLRGSGVAPYEVRISGGGKIVASPTFPDASVYSTGPIARPRGSVFHLDRSATAQMYVVLVACIPLLFECLFALMLVGRYTGAKRGLAPDALMGVAAVLLAILPIRLVLVPAEIQELTLVDYWLGFEMALLAAIACIAAWRSMGNPTPSHEQVARTRSVPTASTEPSAHRPSHAGSDLSA
jgi:hypothetical protein